MKKTLYHIGMLSAVAIALVSCNKEIETNLLQEEVTHVAHVVLTKSVDTKTAVVEGETSASYVWTQGDEQYLNIYECYYTTTEKDGETVVVKNHNKGTISNIEYSADYKTASLTVSFSGNPTGPYTYEAIYAKSVSNNYNPSLQSNQQPTADNFDPSADVMISKATSDITEVDERLTEFSFTMGRVVTVNKMTLTGLVAGEKVQKVEFTLDKHMVGSYTVETGNYTSGGKTLILDYTKGNTTDGEEVATGGNFPVYFISAPVDAAGIVSVVVTTDKNVYTKSSSLDPNPFDGKTITFAIGTMKRFTMAMSGYGEEISTGVEYTLVESADDLFDGATYIIVGSDVNYAVGLFTGGNNHPAVAIEKSVNDQNKSIITIDNTVAVEPVLLNKVGSNWTIKNNASGNSYYGQYLICATGKNNRLQETDSESSSLKEWTISISEGVATIINANSDAQRTQVYYNQNTGNSPMFACYEPGQTNTNYHTIALYVDLNTCTPTLATPNVLAEVQNNNEIYVTWDEVANADGYIVTCTGKADQNVATGVGEATFTALADGTYTITVTAISNDHSAYLDSKPATVEDILVGSPKGSVDNPYTVAEVRTRINGGNTDACYIAGKISSVKYYYDASHATATYFISDDGTTTSAQFEAFSVKFLENKQWAAGNSQIAVGDDVVIYAGGLQIYQETTYETTANSGSYLYSLNGVTSETVPTITKTDISGISADGISNATATVTFANADGWDVAATPDGTIVTAASISGNTITYSVGANGGNARTGSITVTLTKNGRTDVSAVINVAQDANSSSTVTTHTSTLTFTAKCNGSGTADDNVAWTVTSDGEESNFDGTRGIHYGTNSKAVTYIKLSTSGIPGTITKVVVNAAAASEATVSVTVNGSEFGGNAKQLTSSAANYTFEGSASGEIIVTVTKPASAVKALYVKSIVVTYEN